MIPTQQKQTDIKAIRGNAPDEIKTRVAEALGNFTLSQHYGDDGFADSISRRIKIVEVTLNPQENSKKAECVVTSELEVEKDMTSGLRIMHGGCTAFLLDICTSLPLVGLIGGYAGVSLSLSVNYHAPAPIGCKLRVITRSVAVGGRTMNARGEIWDATKLRLLVTGTHMKMSESKL